MQIWGEIQRIVRTESPLSRFRLPRSPTCPPIEAGRPGRSSRQLKCPSAEGDPFFRGHSDKHAPGNARERKVRSKV